MNRLVLGLGAKRHLLDTKQGFLLIDDGPLCDLFLERFKRAKEFNPHKHSFNPLKGIDYKKAREFAAVVYGNEGKDTLTVRNGKRALTRLLLSGSDRLDKLTVPKKADDGALEALAMVDDILLSPVMRKVLCEPQNFAFRHGNPPSSIVARVNRAELGEHDALLLGALLVFQFKGQVIIPDFGFYARDFHASLIREKRLAVGVNSLSELTPKMRQLCMMMEDKTGDRCAYEDAEALARYEGLSPQTVGWNDFMKEMMR